MDLETAHKHRKHTDNKMSFFRRTDEEQMNFPGVFSVTATESQEIRNTSHVAELLVWGHCRAADLVFQLDKQTFKGIYMST